MLRRCKCAYWLRIFETQATETGYEIYIDHIKEDKMEVACSTHGRGEKLYIKFQPNILDGRYHLGVYEYYYNGYYKK
jgi:hypothetical protein